jgi:hypothetical protein
MFEQLGTPIAVVQRRETWNEKGLDAHCVYLISLHVNAETGETIEVESLLDAHWQENTAWKCLERWAARYGVPIRHKATLRKVIEHGK